MRKSLRTALLATGIAVATLSTSALANDLVLVELDLAKVMKLDSPASTVILGNPAIADATIFDSSMLVITGKSYGTTNLIVLDEEGDEIQNSLVTVRAPEQTLLTIHRGSARASYSCAPNCQPSLVLGDSEETFAVVGNQVSTRTSSAEAGAAE